VGIAGGTAGGSVELSVILPPNDIRTRGNANTMVTSDFRPEVEIRPFRACAMKNTQFNSYLWPNRQNSRVIKEIGVEKHDGDVRF